MKGTMKVWLMLFLAVKDTKQEPLSEGNTAMIITIMLIIIQEQHSVTILCLERDMTKTSLRLQSCLRQVLILTTH